MTVIKIVKVLINGESADVGSPISYETLVSYVKGQGKTPTVVYSGKYVHGKDDIRSGSITPGKSIHVDEGMIFSVMDTSNA